MRKKFTLPLFLLGLCFSTQYVDAQFYMIGAQISAEDVNNSGLVGASAGSSENYYWTATDGLQHIGTLSVNTLAGQTLVSEDNDKVFAYMTNPENNLNTTALYTISTGTWTYFEDLGGSMDNSATSPWGISNNGEHIVGLGMLPNGRAHAVRWNANGEITEIGSVSPEQYSRANNVNDDGTVVVGWQDAVDGNRQGAIWVDGVQTILTDNEGNVLGEAGAVSADGSVVVGLYGFYPYVWTQNSYTEITHPDSGLFFRGGATDITADGSTVIGYFRGWPGGPHFGEGFIWTAENGRQNLNEYVQNLGIDTQGYVLALPLAISPDGTKIVGISRGEDGGQYGFYVDLTDYLGTNNQTVSPVKTKIYPNPVKDILNIEGVNGKVSVEILNILGQKIKSEETTSGKINVQNLPKGNYIITINNGKVTTNHKFIKN